MTDYSGVHDVTAALKNTLAAMGVTAPDIGQPLNEALLLGIGGGLGAGYLMFQFQSHGSAAILVMGFRNRWNYMTESMSNTLDRLNIAYDIHETSGQKGALTALRDAVAANLPVITWADKAHLPYQALPERLKGHSAQIVAVHAFDGEIAHVSDLAPALWTVAAADLAAARAQIPSDKNRILVVHSVQPFDLQEAVRAGITDHIEHLSRDSETFSVPVWKKWARLINDRKNKKSWHVMFAERKGLLQTLSDVYEGIRHDGTDGAGLRALYADFLDQAEVLLDQPRLKDAATAYRAAAQAWIAFAESALPANVPAFADRAATIDARYAALNTNNVQEVQRIASLLEDQSSAAKSEFPLDDAGVDDLFADMQTKLNAVYDTEVAALAALTTAV